MTTMAANAAKHPVSGFGALIVMGAMFWVLSTMLEHVPASPVAHAIPIEFTRLIQDTDVESKRKPKPEKPKLKTLPEPPPPDVMEHGPPTGKLVYEPPTSPTTRVAGPSFGIDGDAVPVFQLQPPYPRRAQERGIEGWVALQFTITAAGTVRDVVVIDAAPRGHFEEASAAALLRWKYQPKIVEGRAVERVGNRVVLRFDLEND